MPQGSEQKPSKLAFVGVRAVQVIPFQQSGEEFLREVLGIVGSGSLTSSEKLSNHLSAIDGRALVPAIVKIS